MAQYKPQDLPKHQLSAFAIGEILASFANSPISSQIRFKIP